MKGFYHIWAWRPSWSCYQHHIIQVIIFCRILLVVINHPKIFSKSAVCKMQECNSHTPVKPSHWAVHRFINQTDQRGRSRTETTRAANFALHTGTSLFIYPTAKTCLIHADIIILFSKVASHRLYHKRPGTKKSIRGVKDAVVTNQADQGRIFTEENDPIGDCCTTCSFRQAVIT